MCQCEKRRLAGLLGAGDDLVAAIERANWGTISHPTLHMSEAIAVWKAKKEVYECRLQPKKTA